MSSALTTRVAALRYADEASFAEVSTTFDQRLPIIGQPTLSLNQEMVPLGQTGQYVNESERDVRGILGGTLQLRLALTGLGSTAAGAISANELITFLGYIIGTSDTDQTGSTVDSSADADTFDVANGEGSQFNPGGLIRTGVLNDGRGNGQAAAIDSISTDTIQLLTALDGAPNGSDVVYAMAHVHPNEDVSNVSLTSLRFEVLTANQHYRLYGCFPQSISFTGLNVGETPFVDVTMGIAAWETANGTFPTSTSTDAIQNTPVAAGSVFDNAVGTPTRVTRSIREFNVNIELDVVPLMGPGAPRSHQAIVDATRGRTRLTCDFVVDSEAAGTDTLGGLFNTSELSAVKRHLLFSFSAADGQSVALYLPNAKWMGNRPTQFERNERWAKRASFEATTGTDDTSELTLSAFRWGIG